MAFKKSKQSSISVETPEALFRDLRNRRVQGLLSHQADILREYCKPGNLNAADVAMQLPTGSGKTLVGLLLGEWRRRKYNERVLYLCPTRQLVNQVTEQSATEYGIKTNGFIGSKSDFSPQAKAEYSNAETIAVATYSALFNTSPFFEDPELIILDDAHAAENYIASYWSLEIDRYNSGHKVLFDALVTSLARVLSVQHYSRLQKEQADFQDLGWIEKVPTPYFLDILKEVTDILDIHIKSIRDLRFTWETLRDNLAVCNLYISVNKILIRPIIPPTLTHPPFSKANQRVYMSATLGEGGELERVTGVEKIVRVPPPGGWDKQGNGRRLFFFPERSISEEESLALSVDMVKMTPRSIFLVPNDRIASEVKSLVEKETDYTVFDAKQIEDSKKPFVSNEKAVAIVANRYDGIDLKEDECRLLIIKGLPKALNLQERFLITRMPASILFIDRVITRIVQAIGRCTRTATDYAAVVILGEELNSFLLKKDRRPLLHPEIQAELEFGINESRDVDKNTFLENFSIFLEHGEAWQDAESHILSLRDPLSQKELPGLEQLKSSTIHEIRYQYALWRGDYEGAVHECRSVLDSLSGDILRGYRAFWLYLAGSAAWLGFKNSVSPLEAVARDFFSRAFQASEAEGIPWLLELARLSGSEVEENNLDLQRLATVIEGLESRLASLGTTNNRRFETEIQFIIENIEKSNPDDSHLLEEAHVRIGKLLGYNCNNVETTAAPDPWWVAGDDFCFVFEDHSSESNPETSAIGANKSRQAASHVKWIRDEKIVRESGVVIPVLVSPFKKIDPDAARYADDVLYWSKEDFILWAKQAIVVVRNLRSTFPGEADINWRKKAAQAYNDNNLSPAALLAKLRQQKLAELPRA